MDRERENGRGRDPSSSSDDDDDLETLIAQNEAKPSNPPRRLSGNPRRGSFEIGDIRDRIGRRVSSSRKWLLLLAICVAVVIVLVYFFVDLREVGRVSPVPSSGVAYGSERMREAELRALYLLRDQQLGLLTLWNRTYSSHARSGSRGGTSSTTPQLPPQQPPLTPPMSPPPPAPAMSSNYTKNSSFSLNSTVRHDLVNDFSSLPPTVTLEEFRSALLEQIKLNREIQKVLLSTHHSGNGSWEAPEDNVDAFLADSSGEVCRKVGKPNDRRTLEWKPKKNRYLFAICLSGQMSNHLICLEKHMFFAALLNRVLVFPSPKFDYQYDRVIDINHINECFGRKVVITFDEFAEMKKNKMRIDRFICYMADPPCYVDEDHAKRLKSLGITLAKIEAAWPEDAKSHEQKKRIAGDITAKFASDDEVLAIGDVFYADVEEEWVMQPGGPLAHKCKTVIQPSRLITLTAERFVQTFLGSSFIALHFRRHGFLKFCNVKEESCFFPIPQAAECILHVVERANAPVIYLSTDAAESETKLLQSLVVLNDKQVPLVKRPEHNSVEKWDALLYRNHLGGDGQVEAMLDKTICALSSVFIGSSGSTFTDDILRLRKDWGSASVCDEYLCQGEHPNFVASNE